MFVLLFIYRLTLLLLSPFSLMPFPWAFKSGTGCPPPLRLLTPERHARTTIHGLKIRLTADQVLGLTQACNCLNIATTRQRIAEIFPRRPCARVGAAPQQWWRYACASIIHMRRASHQRKSGIYGGAEGGGAGGGGGDTSIVRGTGILKPRSYLLSTFFQRWSGMRRYVPLYKRYLAESHPKARSWAKALSVIEKSQLQAMEDIFEIWIFGEKVLDTLRFRLIATYELEFELHNRRLAAGLAPNAPLPMSSLTQHASENKNGSTGSSSNTSYASPQSSRNDSQYIEDDDTYAAAAAAAASSKSSTNSNQSTFSSYYNAFFGGSGSGSGGGSSGSGNNNGKVQLRPRSNSGLSIGSPHYIRYESSGVPIPSEFSMSMEQRRRLFATINYNSLLAKVLPLTSLRTRITLALNEATLALVADDKHSDDGNRQAHDEKAQTRKDRKQKGCARNSREILTAWATGECGCSFSNNPDDKDSGLELTLLVHDAKLREGSFSNNNSSNLGNNGGSGKIKLQWERSNTDSKHGEHEGTATATATVGDEQEMKVNDRFSSTPDGEEVTDSSKTAVLILHVKHCLNTHDLPPRQPHAAAAGKSTFRGDSQLNMDRDHHHHHHQHQHNACPMKRPSINLYRTWVVRISVMPLTLSISSSLAKSLMRFISCAMTEESSSCSSPLLSSSTLAPPSPEAKTTAWRARKRETLMRRAVGCHDIRFDFEMANAALELLDDSSSRSSVQHPSVEQLSSLVKFQWKGIHIGLHDYPRLSEVTRLVVGMPVMTRYGYGYVFRTDSATAAKAAAIAGDTKNDSHRGGRSGSSSSSSSNAHEAALGVMILGNGSSSMMVFQTRIELLRYQDELEAAMPAATRIDAIMRRSVEIGFKAAWSSVGTVRREGKDGCTVRQDTARWLSCPFQTRARCQFLVPSSSPPHLTIGITVTKEPATRRQSATTTADGKMQDNDDDLLQVKILHSLLDILAAQGIVGADADEGDKTMGKNDDADQKDGTSNSGTLSGQDSRCLNRRRAHNFPRLSFKADVDIDAPLQLQVPHPSLSGNKDESQKHRPLASLHASRLYLSCEPPALLSKIPPVLRRQQGSSSPLRSEQYHGHPLMSTSSFRLQGFVSNCSVLDDRLNYRHGTAAAAAAAGGTAETANDSGDDMFEHSPLLEECSKISFRYELLSQPDDGKAARLAQENKSTLGMASRQRQTRGVRKLHIMIGESAEMAPTIINWREESMRQIWCWIASPPDTDRDLSVDEHISISAPNSVRLLLCKPTCRSVSPTLQSSPTVLSSSPSEAELPRGGGIGIRKKERIAGILEVSGVDCTNVQDAKLNRWVAQIRHARLSLPTQHDERSPVQWPLMETASKGGKGIEVLELQDYLEWAVFSVFAPEPRPSYKDTVDIQFEFRKGATIMLPVSKQSLHTGLSVFVPRAYIRSTNGGQMLLDGGATKCRRFVPGRSIHPKDTEAKREEDVDGDDKKRKRESLDLWCDNITVHHVTSSRPSSDSTSLPEPSLQKYPSSNHMEREEDKGQRELVARGIQIAGRITLPADNDDNEEEKELLLQLDLHGNSTSSSQRPSSSSSSPPPTPTKTQATTAAIRSLVTPHLLECILRVADSNFDAAPGFPHELRDSIFRYHNPHVVPAALKINVKTRCPIFVAGVSRLNGPSGVAELRGASIAFAVPKPHHSTVKVTVQTLRLGSTLSTDLTWDDHYDAKQRFRTSPPSLFSTSPVRGEGGERSSSSVLFERERHPDSERLSLSLSRISVDLGLDVELWPRISAFAAESLRRVRRATIVPPPPLTEMRLRWKHCNLLFFIGEDGEVVSCDPRLYSRTAVPTSTTSLATGTREHSTAGSVTRFAKGTENGDEKSERKNEEYDVGYEQDDAAAAASANLAGILLEFDKADGAIIIHRNGKNNIAKQTMQAGIEEGKDEKRGRRGKKNTTSDFTETNKSGGMGEGEIEEEENKLRLDSFRFWSCSRNHSFKEYSDLQQQSYYSRFCQPRKYMRRYPLSNRSSFHFAAFTNNLPRAINSGSKIVISAEDNKLSRSPQKGTKAGSATSSMPSSSKPAAASAATTSSAKYVMKGFLSPFHVNVSHCDLELISSIGVEMKQQLHSFTRNSRHFSSGIGELMEKERKEDGDRIRRKEFHFTCSQATATLLHGRQGYQTPLIRAQLSSLKCHVRVASAQKGVAGDTEKKRRQSSSSDGGDGSNINTQSSEQFAASVKAQVYAYSPSQPSSPFSAYSPSTSRASSSSPTWWTFAASRRACIPVFREPLELLIASHARRCGNNGEESDADGGRELRNDSDQTMAVQIIVRKPLRINMSPDIFAAVLSAHWQLSSSSWRHSRDGADEEEEEEYSTQWEPGVKSDYQGCRTTYVVNETADSLAFGMIFDGNLLSGSSLPLSERHSAPDFMKIGCINGQEHVRRWMEMSGSYGEDDNRTGRTLIDKGDNGNVVLWSQLAPHSKTNVPFFAVLQSWRRLLLLAEHSHKNTTEGAWVKNHADSLLNPSFVLKVGEFNSGNNGRSSCSGSAGLKNGDEQKWQPIFCKLKLQNKRKRPASSSSSSSLPSLSTPSTKPLLSRYFVRNRGFAQGAATILFGCGSSKDSASDQQLLITSIVRVHNACLETVVIEFSYGRAGFGDRVLLKVRPGETSALPCRGVIKTWVKVRVRRSGDADGSAESSKDKLSSKSHWAWSNYLLRSKILAKKRLSMTFTDRRVLRTRT
eukprot:jgi/Bigna1/73669/fgenesh1_pg.25_\